MKNFAAGATLLLALAITTNAFGQATATLSGTVQDASGALIPGVEITAVNGGTGVESRSISNDAGTYNFAAMPPGTYTVRASLPSFQTRTFTNVALSANQASRLNFVLEVSAPTTAVEVTVAADRVLLESSPSVGDLLSQKEVVDLPNVTNNVLELVNVMAGVNRNAAGLGIQGTFAGVSASNINVVRDGISVNDQRWSFAGLNSATYINQDMVGEMRMILAPVDAETGRGNGQVQITTRSGTNQFHGAGVWNVRNSALDARTWLDNRTLGAPPTVPWINQNQYTVSAGGPIIKNRTFFYGLWDHNISHARSTVMGQVLSPCMQKGIFRYYDNWNNGPANAGTNAGGTNPVRASVDALGNPLPPATNPDGTPHNGILRHVSLFGQVSGTPTPDCSGMTVSAAPTASGAWDPNRRGFDTSGVYDLLASRAPKGNTYEPIGGSTIPLDGLNIIGNRWTRTVDGRDNLYGVGEPNPRKQVNIKIDHIFSQRHRLATSYSYETVSAADTYMGWPDSFEGRVNRIPQVLSANMTSTLTSNIVNEGRFGMSRMGTNVHHATSVPGKGEQLLALLPKSNGLQVLPQWCIPVPAGSPVGTQASMSWCGENGGLIGARGNGPSAADTIDTSPRWTFADTLSWTAGKHSYRFGASYVRATSKQEVTGSSIVGNAYPVVTLGAAALAPNNAFDRGNATGFRALNPQLDAGLVTANSDRMRDLLVFLNGSLSQIQQGRFINSPNQVGKSWNDPLKGELRQIRDLQQNEFNFFVKDDWKVTNRLTFNLGLRWDYYGVPYDKNGMALAIKGGGANLFGRSGAGFENWMRPGERGKDVEFLFVGPNSPNPDLSVYKRDLNNFGPAVGFSYNLPWLGKDRTIFRGGYQLSYLVQQADIIGPIIQNAPGSAVGATFTGPNGGQYFNFKDALSGVGIPTEPSALPVLPVPVTDRTVNLTVFDPNYSTPYIQNFTASLTHTFTPKLSLDVRYIGTLSRKLGNTFNLNQLDIFQNGLFEAFEAARAGGESTLLDRIFKGIDMRTTATGAPRIVGQNGLTGAEFLRTDTRLNTNLANGTYLGGTGLAGTLNTLNYVSSLNPTLPPITDSSNRGNVLRANGFPENFIVTNPQFGQANLRTNMGYRNYHSMQSEFTIRPTYGIQNSISYTWAKDLGNSPTGTATSVNYTVPWDRAQDYRLDSQMRKHAIRAYGTYSLPIGPSQLLLRNSTGLVARAAEGWQVSWIYNWGSGNPVQASSQRSGWYNNTEPILVNPALFDAQSGKVQWDKNAQFGSYFGSYGSYVTAKDPQCTSIAASLQSLCTLNAVYDKSNSLVFRTPRPGEFSNFRDQIWGPGTWTLDMALSKRIRINERMNMEVRVDGTNILNHPQPANPNLNIQGGTPVTPFGTIERKGGTFVQFSQYGRVFQMRARLAW